MSEPSVQPDEGASVPDPPDARDVKPDQEAERPAAARPPDRERDGWMDV